MIIGTTSQYIGTNYSEHSAVSDLRRMRFIEYGCVHATQNSESARPRILASEAKQRHICVIQPKCSEMLVLQQVVTREGECVVRDWVV